MIEYVEQKFILIDGKDTAEVLKDLKALFESGSVCSGEIRTAEVRGIDRKRRSKYPFRLSGPNVTIKVSNLSMGDKSVQAYGTLEALKIAGFLIPERARRVVLTSKVSTYYFFKQGSVAE